jgi:glycosyltransferase involved in cell wall biosynthesis
MRVLVVSHGHPAFSIGGAEVASHALFRGLNATPETEAFYLARAAHPLRPHQDTPLSSFRQGPRETFLHADAYDHWWLSNRAPETLDGALADFLNDLRPDVVHFHHIIGFGVEAIALVRRVLPKAAIVFTFHEYLAICAHHGQMVKTAREKLCHGSSPADCAACFPEHTAEKFFQRERFLQDHFALADGFVSPSRFLRDRYVAWGLPSTRFSVIENGLDVAERTPPRTLAKGGRRARFAFFGQVTRFKGVHVLLDAVSRIPDDAWGTDAALEIFGGNLETQPEKVQAEINALLAKVGPRARLHGAYQGHELPRLMAQADWVVMPSIWWENAPVVIQEAFHHRRPLIVSDIGGMAEKVRHGVDGLHFRASSAQDLAETMAMAMGDRTLWGRLSAAAPAVLDLHQAAGLHRALYSRLLHERGGAAATMIMAAPPRRKARVKVPA